MIFATRHRKLVLFLFSITTLFFGFKLSNITFGHELDDFFDKKEDVYLFNKKFFEHFEKKEINSGLIGITNEKAVNFSIIQEIDSFTRELKKIPLVKEVYSITNQKLAVFSSFATIPYPVLELNSELSFKNSLLELDSIPDVKDRYFSEDNKSIVIYLSMRDSVPNDTISLLNLKIKELSSKFSFQEVLFINTQNNNLFITEKIKTDSKRLVILAIILILIILLYFFRSLHGVVIPFIVVVGSVIWIMGTIATFGISLNVLTIAIPVIVGVISLSDVIHIISRYSEEKVSDKMQRIKATQKDIIQAIILTTITTSLGFLSLANSNIKVFTEFAMFTAIGVFYAFFIAYFILPPLLFYSKKITLHNSLNKLTPSKIYQKPTLIISFACLILVGIGISKVKHNNYVFDNLNQKDDIGKVMNFLEKKMYGIRDLIVTVSLKDSNASLLDKKSLVQLNKIETFIEKNYQTSILVGLATRAKQINRALNGGKPSHFVIPEKESSVRQIKGKLLKLASSINLNEFVSKKKKFTYIQTKTKDFGSNKTNEINQKLLEFAIINTPDLSINFGGNAYIVDNTNKNVSEGMIWNLLLIIFFLFILIAIIFNSFYIGLYSLFPNILPLLFITAVVGWMGYGMNIATTIVYTIAFGIAVDDTIHFLGRYKIESKRNSTNEEALIATLKTSGGAILLTSLILIFGFGVLIISNFYANFITGLLVCVGLITALLCDLFLLPVILNWLKKKE